VAIILIVTNIHVAFCRSIPLANASCELRASWGNQYNRKFNGLTIREEEGTGTAFVAVLDLDESLYEEDDQGSPITDLQVVGTVDIFGGDSLNSAHAHAQVEVGSFTNTYPYDTQGITMGTLRYEFSIWPRSPPPSPIPGGRVPLSVFAAGEVSPTTRDGGYAMCTIILQSGVDGRSYKAETDGVPVFAELFTLWVDSSGSPATCTLQASATVNVKKKTMGGGTAQATVDPSFAFDQASFDEVMGPNTFSLADYFDIEVSGGIDPVGATTPPQEIPEEIVLLAPLCIGIGLLARKGR
jgi:hypothetical protein